MATTKDSLLAKLSFRRYTEVHGVRLRSLTPLESTNLRGAWAARAAKIGEKDKAEFIKHDEKCDIELLTVTIVDEDGDLVFGPSDVAALLESSDERTIKEIANAAYAHCLVPRNSEAIEANAKKSDAPADSKLPE